MNESPQVPVPQVPSEGRIVHVYSPGTGHCQPAIVVRAWSPTTINCLIFRDGSNDPVFYAEEERSALVAWATSISYAEHPSESVGRTWHWPERV